MPFENLNNNHFLPAEKTAVATNLAALEATLTPKIKNLSAEERQRYGSINELNKLIVNKSKEYKTSQPSLSSPYLEGLIERENTFTMVQLAESVNKFISFNDYKVLEGKGRISKIQADKKAIASYEVFNKTQNIIFDFDKEIKKIK
jgi:hypothetical protein